MGLLSGRGVVMRSVSHGSTGRLVAALVIAGGLLAGSLIGSAGAHVTGDLSHLRSHLDAFYAKTYYRRTAAAAADPGQEAWAFAKCPKGTKVIGGGVYAPANWSVVTSYPAHKATTGNTGFNGWASHVRNDAVDPGSIRVYAVCQRTTSIDSNYAPNISALNLSGGGR